VFVSGYGSEKRVTKAELEERLARGMSVEAIAREIGRHASTVSYWMAKHGLEAPLRQKHAARGALDEDAVVRMVEEGLSIAQIAEAVARSRTTVRHWLNKYGLETQATSRRRHAKTARAGGRQTAELECAHHGVATFVREGRGSFRCTRCRSEAVAKRRRLVKSILLEEARGRCVICGYDRSPAALQFHHLDPAQKSFAIARVGTAQSLERVRQEARKCVPLCSNCHAEVEAGLAIVPVPTNPA
jgi:transposase